MLITFSGLDGAGKSTLAEGLVRRLEASGRAVTYLHMNEDVGLYPCLRRLLRMIRPPSSPRRPVPRPTGRRGLRRLVWSRPLRRVVFLIDLAMFVVLRAWTERFRRRILVLDRYFFDTLVDVGGADTRAWYGRLLERLVAPPDLAVFVAVPPAVAYARKGEYSPEYLGRRWASYQELFRRVPNGLWLKNEELAASEARLEEAVRTLLGQARGEAALALEAATLLRVLLGAEAANSLPATDWDTLKAVASSNGILLNTAEALQSAGASAPPEFSAQVDRERRRVEAVQALCARIAAACETEGLSYLFPKSFGRLPDMGDDVDVLLVNGSRADVARIAGHLGGRTVEPNIEDRIGGRLRVVIPGAPAPVDFMLGVLGRLGEAERLVPDLESAATTEHIAGRRHPTARPEDRVVLQGLERVYGRRSLRLGDFLPTMRKIRGGDLDWDRVIGLAEEHGIDHGLACYLKYADQLHHRLTGDALIPDPVWRRLPQAPPSDVEIRGGRLAYPYVRVGARLSASRWANRLRTGDWSAAARLSLAPAIAGAAALRHVRRRFQAKPEAVMP